MVKKKIVNHFKKIARGHRCYLLHKQRRSVSSCKMFSLSEALVFGKAVIFVTGLRISIVRNSGEKAERGTSKNMIAHYNKNKLHVPRWLALVSYFRLYTEPEMSYIAQGRAN
jgi:hypothetical protein